MKFTIDIDINIYYDIISNVINGIKQKGVPNGQEQHY